MGDDQVGLLKLSLMFKQNIIFFVQRIPQPMTAEQILQDLKNAPKNDVVFTTRMTRPENATRGKGQSRLQLCRPFTSPSFYVTATSTNTEKEVNRVAADSVCLVAAYDKLENYHRSELPLTIGKVEQQITDLKAVLSSRTH